MSNDAQIIDTDSGWRKSRGEPSLIDVFRSIKVRNTGSIFRRALAFVGPGYLVSVGYMDPGNWATSIAGGAQFGYTLLFVALLSNIMAIILQSLCARLAIGSGRDLAQACRDSYNPQRFQKHAPSPQDSSGLLIAARAPHRQDFRAMNGR